MTTPRLLSAHSLMSDRVQQPSGEHLGDMKELMIDLDTGRIAYAVLSFGGFLGLGDKLFALPWSVFHVDTDEKALVLDVPKETLEQAPGFDKSNWPAGPEHWGLVDTHWADYRRVA
ncbi:MAG: PRC-barrel domain-containing protein [Acidimicrobiia bacterium]